MLNNANKTATKILETVKRVDDVLVKLAIEARDTAARNLEAACKRVRENTCAAMDDLYSDAMDQAFAAFETACDDLRETRDGYRYTYPHPVALVPHGRRYPVR
jgi:hypothetical protein